MVLALSLMGPPALEVSLLHHIEAQRNHVAAHMTLQVAAAGFDIWTTKRCLDAGTCREVNPFSASDRVPYGLKAATFAVPAALAIWADLTGRDNLAWIITGLAVVLQTAFGIHNILVAR